MPPSPKGEKTIYAITGITGRIGGGVAKNLLAAGHKIRAVVRDPQRAEAFAAQGAEVAIADFNDVAALTKAFESTEGVFIMIPPYFAPEPGFPEARTIIAALREALLNAQPAKVVVLSSVGAQHDRGLGLIAQLHLLEDALSDLPMPVAFIRAGWFIENAQWDIEPARETGEFPSFLQPLDRPIPMIATNDVSQAAAETLLSNWSGIKAVELEAPQRYSPNDLAAALSNTLGRLVKPVVVPREEWTSLFEAGGMPVGRTEMRAEMVDGFNSGWIDFEGESIKGATTLEEAIAALVGPA